jgi:hypothetical protein
VTRDQSASSSSASATGTPVIEPCPISAAGVMIVSALSGAMRTHAPTSTGCVLALAFATSQPPVDPTPTANVSPAVPPRNSRRDTRVFSVFAKAMAQASCAARWIAAMMRV